MMTDVRDPVLQSLFAENRYEKDEPEFTARVVARTRSLRYKIIAGLALIALVIFACAWVYAVPLQEAVQMVTRFLATRLFDLGNSQLAWILSPINNFASLLVLSAKLTRMAWKKTRSVSFSK